MVTFLYSCFTFYLSGVFWWWFGGKRGKGEKEGFVWLKDVSYRHLGVLSFSQDLVVSTLSFSLYSCILFWMAILTYNSKTLPSPQTVPARFLHLVSIREKQKQCSWCSGFVSSRDCTKTTSSCYTSLYGVSVPGYNSTSDHTCICIGLYTCILNHQHTEGSFWTCSKNDTRQRN